MLYQRFKCPDEKVWGLQASDIYQCGSAIAFSSSGVNSLARRKKKARCSMYVLSGDASRGIAVGTAIDDRPPRTDPYAKYYLIRLLLLVGRESDLSDSQQFDIDVMKQGGELEVTALTSRFTHTMQSA